MNRVLAVSAVALALGAGIARAKPPDPQAQNVDPALRQSIAQFNEAFNRGDARAVASFWAQDGTLINPAGREARGPAEVARVFGEDSKSILGGSTSVFTIRSVRQLSPDTVFLDLEHTLNDYHAPDGTVGTKHQHVAMVARKQGDTWKALDVRPYAFVQPPPQTGAAGD